MQLVLVSACLLGAPVRYDGSGKRSDSGILQRWIDAGRVVPVCPEVAGGLPVPRPAAEITAGVGGHRVLAGSGSVVDAQGRDLTAQFVAGARQALQLAQLKGIQVAVLKEGSPSCGSGRIYDGSFSAQRLPGAGVTTALLRSAGLVVFSEAEFEAADALLAALEAQAADAGRRA